MTFPNGMQMAHLSLLRGGLFRARCGADAPGQATVEESVATLGVTERPICPRCVALVLHDRADREQAAQNFKERFEHAENRIAQARRQMRAGRRQLPKKPAGPTT